MKNWANRATLTAQEIVALYQAGKTSTEIGRLAGVSCVAILSCLRRAGVSIRPAVQARRFDYAAMAADYQGGMTFTQVAAKHHATVSMARKVIIASGVALRPTSESFLRGDKHPFCRGGKR